MDSRIEFKDYHAEWDTPRINLEDLGVPHFHPTKLDWRQAAKVEIKDGCLVGRYFKHKKSGASYLTKKTEWLSNKKPALIHYEWGVFKVSEVLYFLPTKNLMCQMDRLKWLLDNNKDYVSVIIPKRGCQLHGDIDASIFDRNGNEWLVAYNY